ncbi:MAG: DNA repair protein RecN [Trueperaceae bacterium]|nr:MAG: DNA repair protein RecN [Trueperaceae bacterium]
MLIALELRNFAIIEELRIELAPGLNVLTGETGAGKSIVVGALALLTGDRADHRLIRRGGTSALIQGIFDHPVIESASRRLVANGRSTARLNGELVTVGELASQGGQLVAIHGQHTSQTLLGAGEQRRQLDQLLPTKDRNKLATYRETFKAYTKVIEELSALNQTARERVRKLDILAFQQDEIESAGLKPGEDVELQERALNLRNAEKIAQGTGKALGLLIESEDNASALLAEATRHLAETGRYHKTLAVLAEELKEALASVEAIGSELGSFLGNLEPEADALDTVERRISTIERLKQKYGDTIEAILVYLAEAKEELAELENTESSLASLEAHRSQLRNRLAKLGEDLHKARVSVAVDLGERITELCHQLGMPKARFMIDVAMREEFTPSGLDQVRFHFSANLGENPEPLSAVASGGELSRIMLALNVVTDSELPTLVFDEIDSGIGGTTAKTVGKLLKKLAETHQVLVVTHLPQVAAFADAQFRVDKEEKGGRTLTRVSRLSSEQREIELARMLSGNVTEASMNHARELLADAQSTH